MWCTRWFLPLLLLPLPTAPPYFLLLFLFSLTMHAKPCFYCIVLLTTLFVSSCYWQPFPIDSPLSTPWAENVTTFAEALNATIMTNYAKPLPDVMRTVDRCWCDFSAGGFFEPFNVSHWEHVSVQRLKTDLERQQKAEEAAVLEIERPQKTSTGLPVQASGMPRTADPLPSPSIRTLKGSNGPNTNIWAFINPFQRRGERHPPSSDPPSSQTSPLPTPVATIFSPSEKLPLIRKEYDLRPYGVGILIDFGWTR